MNHYVNRTLGNNQNLNIFIQEKAFENVVCEIADILPRLSVFNKCFVQSDDSANQHINNISIANALGWLMHLNCFMGMNSGMLSLFL